MGKIRVLEEHIANQIAAGEVVERPASVVKELVENAIDAGADRIDVEIGEGGIGFMRVADNGSGMEADDCETAFLRHATSKISSGSDLFRIRSLGFRGEALPSIAAVSKVECLTASGDDGRGKRLLIEGGSVKAFGDAASTRGTDIRVSDLFFNTPARLKYMRTIQTELGHISDYVYRIALAHPGIAFTLSHNGNRLLRTSGGGDLLQVIAAIYGTAVARNMASVQSENADYQLTGYVSKPELTRSNRSGMTFVMNGRTIRNYSLPQAVLQAYHTLLPLHRFPLAVVHVRMEPSLMDVNVHPNKLEVRFSKERELIELLQQAIGQALKGSALIPRISRPRERQTLIQEQLELYRPEKTAGPDAPPSGARADASSGGAGTNALFGGTKADASSGDARANASSGGAGTNAPFGGTRAGAPSSSTGANEPFGDTRTNAAFGGTREDASFGVAGTTASSKGGASPANAGPFRSHPQGRAGNGGDYAAVPRGDKRERPTVPDDAAEALLSQPHKGERAALPAFPKLFPIGQMKGTYILAQNEDGLYLIDQHAAHERINYEHFYELFGHPAQASQELVIPIPLEFTPTDARIIAGRLAVFEQAGVYMEAFGGNTFIIRSLPHWIPQGEEKQIVEEMAEWVLSEKERIDIAKLREKSAILCSCKASIKANDAMTLPEIEALLDRLASCRTPYTCPHGRPVVVSISNYELEKMFKRVM